MSNMITRQAIIEWREIAPWILPVQVEQDLIIGRALIELFSDEFLKNRLAFRGGTSIHRLFMSPALRYSEDIDLVQTSAESIGPVIDKIREVLIFLGIPTVKQKKNNKYKTDIFFFIDFRFKDFYIHSFHSLSYSWTDE